MKKALFLAPSAYPVGGVATWLSYLLPALQTRDWAAVLALASGRQHNLPAYLRAHPYEKVLAMECATGSREGRVRAICSLIEAEKPELVVSANIADSFAAVTRLRAKRKKFHFCMSLHGFDECYQQDIQDYAGVLDAVVVTNRLTHKIVCELTGYQFERVLYAPYGVDVSKRVNTDILTNTVVRIGYCGRLAAVQKRVSDIPPILEHLERLGVDYTLLVAGIGPEEHFLKERLSAPGFAEKIQFLGNLNQPELRDQFYSSIDVLLVTSEWETGPIVAWEAMSNGVLLVSSRFRGHIEEGALESGCNCLLFDIGNCQAAAKRILELRNNKTLANNIRQNAIQLVRSRYSVEASVAAWDKAFHQILRMAIRPVPRRPTGLPKAGRLDSLFGSRAGETARKWLGKSFHHTDPGSEWPHSYS